jgi:hypothetical protein
VHRDEIVGIQQQVTQFRARDLTHAELGTVNGFHDVELSKNSIAEYFERIVNLCIDVFDSLDPNRVTTELNALAIQISELISRANTIDSFVAKNINTPDYPTRRSDYIEDFKARGHTARKQLEMFEVYLRVAALERQTRPDELNAFKNDASSLLAELRASADEATKILANVRDKVLAKGIQEAEGTFAALSNEHAKQERLWFATFVGLAALTVGAIIAVLATSVSVSATPTVFIAIFKRLLAISAPAVFMRVTLAKYNVERNLRIIYSHRETVIAQFRIFETAIGDANIDAKNQLRLEIAKYIFTDPVTGYLSADSADININPVISTVEKIASRGAT